MVLYIAAPPPDHKTCTNCGQCEKHSKNNNRRDGLQTQCVQCNKAHRAANKDKINAQKKQHYEENKDEICARQKAYYEENKDEISARHKAYHEAHKDEIIARKKKYYEENRDEIIAKKTEYVRNRYQTDDAFRLLKICRRRLSHALKGELKVAKTLELIGCTPDELLEHLERTMSPEVRARRDDEVEIVVDHIIPCAAFDFSIAEHQRMCFNYTNLQYLDKPTNMSKSDKLPDGFDFASWFAARATSIKISPL